jgi:hypothetical protein
LPSFYNPAGANDKGIHRMPPHRGVHWTTGLLSADLCVIKGHKQAHLFENDKKKLEAIG